MQPNRAKSRGARVPGFTLIEMMIVVVVIAILLAIAYPTYMSSVREARRSDAKAALVELANHMERHYSNHMRYDQDSAGNAVSLPFTSTPRDKGSTYYNLSLDSVGEDSFELHASPTGPQSGDPCGTLTLNHQGGKGVTGASKSGAECW